MQEARGTQKKCCGMTVEPSPEVAFDSEGWMPKGERKGGAVEQETGVVPQKV